MDARAAVLAALARSHVAAGRVAAWVPSLAVEVAAVVEPDGMGRASLSVALIATAVKYLAQVQAAVAVVGVAVALLALRAHLARAHLCFCSCSGGGLSQEAVACMSTHAQPTFQTPQPRSRLLSQSDRHC